MQFTKSLGSLICASVLLLAATAWAKPANQSAKKSSHHLAAKTKASKHGAKSKHASAKFKSKKGAWKHHGQQTIADDRTREIQAALIREKYLDGEPTGEMDARTKAALTRMQQENGWQTKIVPDARALIKLGLGPNHNNLLNPETAAYASSGESKAQ